MTKAMKIEYFKLKFEKNQSNSRHANLLHPAYTKPVKVLIYY